MAQRLLHNFWLKIFSLGLATMIWVTIHIGITRDFSLTNPSLTHPSRQFVTLPISVVTQPGDGRVFKITPKEVTATIDGEEAIVRRMGTKDIKVYVDLTDLKSGAVTNSELRADAPREVTVVGLVPTVVSIEQVSP